MLPTENFQQNNYKYTTIYRVAQKSKPLPNYQKIVLNRISLDFFVKLKKCSSTVGLILSVGIKYSLRDLLFDVNNYASPTVSICVTCSK